MATTPVQIEAPSGLTLTLELYPHGSDTIANGAGDTLTEETNRHGVYSASVTESLTGLHHAIIVDASNNSIATYHVDLADTTAIHYAGDIAAFNNISVADILAGTGDTGVSIAKCVEIVAALAAGKVSASSVAGVTTLTYKMRDGTTTSFTTVVTEADKTRATTGALS